MTNHLYNFIFFGNITFYRNCFRTHFFNVINNSKGLFFRGKIINISSTNAINSFSPDAIDYDASKAGVITLTKDFAKELAPKIQVNAIAPGWVDTDMNRDLPKEFVEDETRKIYLKRFALPEEIAKAILFFASDEASYITGSILVVDGGHD